MADLDAARQKSDDKDWAKTSRFGLRVQNLVFLAFGLTIFPAFAAPGQQTPASYVPASISGLVEAGERQLEDGRSALDEGTLVAARKIFEECVHQNTKNFLCYYDLSRTESSLEKVKEAQKDNKAAEHWLDSAIESAKHAIDIDDRSSDAHALLGDLYGMKIGFGGMFAGMHYGPKANAETQRAFELDANNPRAYAVVGRKYLFAPRMFGGDLDKAVQSFQKATTLDPHYDEAFVWLALAYRRKGDSQHAQAALSEALRLNSRSAFAKRIQSEAAGQVQ